MRCKGVFSKRDNYSYPDPQDPCPEVTPICSLHSENMVESLLCGSHCSGHLGWVA